MNWLEVSLVVNGEAAEAVADVLARFAPEGVVIEATQIESTPNDEGHAVGPVRVRAYLNADDKLDATRAQLEQALWHLGQLLPLPQPHYQPIANADWSESWKANFQPVRAGGRLMIIPAWLYERFANDPHVAPSDIPIVMDPGMAFGTGTHPTTQLCLAAIERHLKPGAEVLDLGTGSGILAIAAAKLGAGPIWALDIDAEAVRVARENVAANGVADRVRVEQGSVAEVLQAGYSAPFVVANILARVINDLLAQGLAHAVTPGGLLVASGILDSQAYEVRAGLQRHGLTVLA
ncbi:MAG: 50S ribosomal protein L11 methyltransferase, partial [Anaerolineales bacterium]